MEQPTAAAGPQGGPGRGVDLDTPRERSDAKAVEPIAARWPFDRGIKRIAEDAPHGLSARIAAFVLPSCCRRLPSFWLRRDDLADPESLVCVNRNAPLITRPGRQGEATRRQGRTRHRPSEMAGFPRTVPEAARGRLHEQVRIDGLTSGCLRAGVPAGGRRPAPRARPGCVTVAAAVL
jgi:hypothetical protein